MELESPLSRRVLVGRSITIVLIAALSACSTYGPSGPLPAKTAGDLEPLHFQFRDGGHAIYFDFKIGSKEPKDIIFFISGSGCASLQNKFPSYFYPMRDKANVHIVALQKRGIDANSDGSNCSPDFIETDYLSQTVEDQREFIEAELKKSYTPPQSVVLMGASEGAVVASKIAATESRITHLALIGGGGSTLRANLRILSRTQWYLRSPESTFSEISSDPTSISKEAWGHSYKYWNSILDVDIGQFLLSLDIPIISAMGEKDESVPIDTALNLQREFSKRRKTNFKLLIYPNANHKLVDPSNNISYSGSFLESFASELLQN